MNVKPEIENLARYLVNERSRVDWIHPSPYLKWNDADDRAKAAARVRAQMILAGEVS